MKSAQRIGTEERERPPPHFDTQVLGEGTRARSHFYGRSESEIEHVRARIEHLRAAAHHLREAGAEQEARAIEMEIRKLEETLAKEEERALASEGELEQARTALSNLHGSFEVSMCKAKHILKK